MEIKLIKDKKEYTVQVSPPTYAIKDKLRKLTTDYTATAVKLDKKYEKYDLENDLIALIEKSNELDKLNDEFLIRNIKEVLTDIPEDIKPDVASEVNSDFWKSQNLDELNKAITFFRSKK